MYNDYDNGYGTTNDNGIPNGYGVPNGYNAPNGYGVPNGYNAPNGYGVPNGYSMQGGYGTPMMSKGQFFKQPQYKSKLGAITFGAVSMYIAAFLELIIAISAENMMHILFMIFSIAMGVAIQVGKNSVCAIISSVFYGYGTMIYVVIDIVLLFAGTVAIFDLAANDALKEFGIVMVILVILEAFLSLIPMIGAIMASVAAVKINGDWGRYKMSFYRRW